MRRATTKYTTISKRFRVILPTSPADGGNVLNDTASIPSNYKIVALTLQLIPYQNLFDTHTGRINLTSDGDLQESIGYSLGEHNMGGYFQDVFTKKFPLNNHASNVEINLAPGNDGDYTIIATLELQEIIK